MSEGTVSIHFEGDDKIEYRPETGILSIPSRVQVTSEGGEEKFFDRMTHRQRFDIGKAVSQHYKAHPTTAFENGEEHCRIATSILSKVLSKMPVAEPSTKEEALEKDSMTFGVGSLLQGAARNEARDAACMSAEESEVTFEAIITEIGEQLSTASIGQPSEMASRLGASLIDVEDEVCTRLKGWLLDETYGVPDPEALTVQATFTIGENTLAGTVLVEDRLAGREISAPFEVKI